MEINKAKQKKKLQKKIIPLAIAAVLTVQGTSVPVWGGVSDNNSLGSTYRVTKRAVVADVTAKNLTLEANKKVKITATGYTVGSGMEESYTGAYVFTTNGTPVADANIEIEGVPNADITLKDCHLTSTQNTGGANKGLFSFTGGKVNLKLEGKNSITYTGSEATYVVGSTGVNEDLTVSGLGSLYLKNVSLQTAGAKIEIKDGKVYSGNEIKTKEIKLTGGVLATNKLNILNGGKFELDGTAVVYAKDLPIGNSDVFTNGVLYIGTTVTLNEVANEPGLSDGLGTMYGNPDIPNFKRPEGNSKLLIEINKNDVTVKDVEYTGKEAKPEITVRVNRHITGEINLTENDYRVEITGDKVNVGDKNITITPKQDTMCKGAANTTFKVIAKDISKVDEIFIDDTDKPYTGVEQERAVAATFGGITLQKGTDYNVETGTDKGMKAGEYTLKITGAGNYNGKIERKWKITKALLAVSEAAIAPKVYNGNTDATVTAVTLAGIKASESLAKGTDYDATATFSDKTVGTNKTVTVKVALKNTEKAKNYELTKDTLMLTGQEIKKGKHQKPPIAGTVYVDENDPDNKFMYSVGIVKGAEYQIGGAVVGNPDESKWQDSNIFKCIEPTSTHVFYIRMKASEGMDASEPDNKTVTFNKIANINKPNLQYKITDGTTANTKKITLTTEAGVEYSFDGGASYEITGIKDNLPAGTPVQLWARFKATNTRNASSETKQTVDVSKNTYNAPAPILEEGTYYVDPSNEDKFEYKVKTVGTAPAGKTYEYSKDLMTWITPTAIDGTVTFGAIEPKSTVTFYARIKAEGEDGAGVQGIRTVTFKRLKRVDKPVLVATVGGIKGNKTVTISAVNGAQYKFGKESWQLDNVKHHITDEKMIVGIRFGETNTYEASEPVFKEIVVNETSGSTGGGNGAVVPLPSTEDKKPEAGKDDKKPDMDKENKKSDTAKDGNVADKAKPVAKVNAESVSKNKAEANVSSDDIKEALEAARESEKNIVRLKVAVPKGTKSVDVKLEKGILNSFIESAIKAFEVTVAKVKVQLENKAISLIDKKGEGDINLSIDSVTKLSAKEKKIAGKRPVYKISLKSGETKITDLGEGKAKISLPYNKTAKEKSTGLYVAYFNKKGKAVHIKASYNDKNKTLTFSTKYLTKYVVGYKAPKKNK